ncbi:MAG: transcription elongation factor GreA [Ardenticatenaceae bacterium]|nr:transcription elongation factor GreA [Ardenticatenaceae bacterium]HBY99429.1 transcription elongation factor GreA [Chloroflexota bacterium]
MADKPTLLTVEGKRKLEEELHHLKAVRRPQVAERIRQAKEEGDLRENAEYDDAKMEQGFIEGRIRELEALLKHVQIIDSTNGNSMVTIGSTVSVREEDEQTEEVFTVVGSAEADPTSGRISNESPLGRSLLGRKPGDQVQVQTPGGLLTFIILKIL